MKLIKRIGLSTILGIALLLSSCTTVNTPLESEESIFIDLTAKVQGFKDSTIADDLIAAQKEAKGSYAKAAMVNDLKDTKKTLYAIKTELTGVVEDDFKHIIEDGLIEKGFNVVEQDNSRYRFVVMVDVIHDRSKSNCSVDYNVAAKLEDTSHVRKDELQGVELDDYDNFIDMPVSIDTLDHFATNTWNCSGTAFGKTEEDALYSAFDKIEKEYTMFLSKLNF